jgi:hypothetical protein
MASSTKDGVNTKAKELGYDETMNLPHSKVGAYLFNFKNKSSRKVIVEPIEVSETGFDVKTIDSTIDKLNETSEELFHVINYGLPNELHN